MSLLTVKLFCSIDTVKFLGKPPFCVSAVCKLGKAPFCVSAVCKLGTSDRLWLCNYAHGFLLCCAACRRCKC